MGTSAVVSSFDFTSLFAGEPPVRHRSIILASGSNAAPVNNVPTPLKRGALLGRVTASDKYIPCVKTATDGSQTPAAVLATDTDASAADVSTVAYFEGEFAFEIMTVDPSWTYTTLDAATRQAALDIFIRSVGTLG